MTVRTRVAPSPTGDPHVGTAYVALVNYCFAKQQGGEFILRIEDTDRARSTMASERMILRSLRWLGLDWHEGPDIGGPVGPYRQSERAALYQEHAEKLLETGHAFRCFCTPQRLEEMRQHQRSAGKSLGYDGRCKYLSPAEVKTFIEQKIPYVVRLDVPQNGVCIVRDFVRGDIEVDWSTVDMQILLKSDGLPTYHLANVVDDHYMNITHVIRGEEWMSSAPKHLLLYEYFGWKPPALAHLPLLRNPDRSKLSKRKNPTSILWYERMGYLPEALLNYLGMITSAILGEQERFDLAYMVERLDLRKISLAGPIFDIQKLDWLNGRWIREALDVNDFAERVAGWAINREYLMPIAALVQSRISKLSDLGQLTAFFFSGRIEIPVDKLVDGKMSSDEIKKSFQLAMWKFDALPIWNREGIEASLRSAAEHLHLPFKNFVRAFYIAITGNPSSAPLFDSMELLGRDLCRDRLRYGIQLLGGVSSKETKLWLQEMTTGPTEESEE
jgi:glutamyl-tRNA synthetase